MLTHLSRTLLESEDGKKANEILRKCVHCGFCNATCPTYNLLGNELDGPRGRIYLMKSMLERESVDSVTVRHLDRCLHCLNCEVTCPSGVEYGQLLDIGRRYITQKGGRVPTLMERVALAVVPRPWLARWLLRVARVFRLLAPAKIRETLATPIGSAKSFRNPTAKVVILKGCIQSVLAPMVTDHLGKLLIARGVQVRTVDSEVCCGGLHAHLGFEARAAELARKNIRAMGSDKDTVILSTATGCEWTLREYGEKILRDDPAAQSFAQRTKNIAVYLESMDFSRRYANSRVAFHSPCTLQHGQRITGVVEGILTRVGYQLIPIPDSHTCCGSAGTYSILQPALSGQLREAKLAALIQSNPDVIATANVGCHLHLAAATDTPVKHWIELLE